MTTNRVPKNTVQIVGRKYFKNTVEVEETLKVLGVDTFDIKNYLVKFLELIYTNFWNFINFIQN